MNAQAGKFKTFVAHVRAKLGVFDWRDLCLVVGAGLVFRGVYMFKPALAYIVLGSALVWFALFADRRK